MSRKRWPKPAPAVSTSVPLYVDYLSTDALARALEQAELRARRSKLRGDQHRAEVWQAVADDLKLALASRQMALEI